MGALLNSLLGMTLAASFLAFVIIGGFYTLRNDSAKLNWARIAMLALFVGYMSGLFSLTLELAYVMEYGLVFNPTDWNIIPFREILRFLPFLSTWQFANINLLGNILIFVPVGFAVALLLKGKRPLLRGWLWSMLISVFIECFQLFTPRATDIDDVILNSLGGMLGVLLYLIFRKIFPRVAAHIRQPVIRKSLEKKP